MGTPALSGILAPTVTPFNERGEIDLEAFSANLRLHLAAGLNGIVVAGTSGEFSLLDDRERDLLVDRARRELPDGIALVAGAGAESTREAITRARNAADRGADFVLLMAPHYYGPWMSDEALAGHFLRVADESPCPVMLYNNPRHAHAALTPALVGRLARHENIRGMKDSAGDLVALRLYTASQDTTFRVLTGHGPTFHEALILGVTAAILAVSVYAPAAALAVLSAHRDGQPETARDAQRRLALLAREIAGDRGPAGIKAALDLVGGAGGAPRPPLLPVTDRERAVIARVLDSGGVRAAA